jgi:uncharacterized protein YbjT (DUF2867 family)
MRTSTSCQGTGRLGAVRVVVLGGAGLLGRALVSELLSRGVDTVGASRRSGVDLENGSGLVDVLAGADAVVHAATSPMHARRVDLAGTRRVVRAVRAAGGSTHIVYVSIVGCDANPYPYYRVKAACEHELETGEVRATVVRATQFHPLVAGIARAARPLRVGLTLRGMVAQPCDVDWVARRVADVATDVPPIEFARSPDLAGPERVMLGQAVRQVAAHDGVRVRQLVTLPALGRVARAFATGTNLPGPDAVTGGPGFSEWLVRQPIA